MKSPNIPRVPRGRLFEKLPMDTLSRMLRGYFVASAASGRTYTGNMMWEFLKKGPLEILGPWRDL